MNSPLKSQFHRSAFLHLITGLFLLPVLCFAQAGGSDKVKHVEAAEAAKLVEEGKMNVLDVRTPDEFKEGHIKGAVNVDIFARDFEDRVKKLEKGKPLLVHCQAGGRSTRSLPALEKLGFTQIYHLDGGMKGWIDAGKPVEK